MKKGKVLIIQLSVAFLLLIGTFIFAFIYPNADTSDVFIEEIVLTNYDESNLLDFTTINPTVLEDIAYAETIADVVIVCPHWGTEYVSEPSSYQERFAQQMTEAGADLIIGTHPHAVQPVQWVLSENGNRALCFYSLGNFLSTQKKV